MKHLKKAIEDKEVLVEERELEWLDILESELDDIADDEIEFYNQIKGELDMTKFLPSEYGLE